MGFEENSITCPRCGQIVPSGNAYCGACGAQVSSVRDVGHTRSRIEPTSSVVRRPPAPLPPKYDRQLSMFERFTKLLTSPREAMEDIGRAPDYGGVIVLFILWTIIGTIGYVITLQKIQFVGTYSSQINAILAAASMGIIILIPIVLIVRWLIKSYLIRHLTDSNSWTFETAASVTGYAYLPNLIFAFVGIFISWLLLPSIIINTSNLEQALAQMELFTNQTLWLTIGINTLLSVAALFWKSNLGSYGTYYGTHMNYEKDSAFAIFLLVGGIGLVIDLFSNFL